QAFDIGWVAPETDRYVLTSTSAFPGGDQNAYPGNRALLIFDAKNDKFLTAVKGFTRPRGVVTVNRGTEAWVRDGDNKVKVVDLKEGKIVATIPGSAKEGGIDENAYDAKDGVVAMTQPDDEPSSLILIHTADRKVFAKVLVPEASDGFEQPAYSKVDGMFHVFV